MKKFRQEQQTQILELDHLTDENFVINNQAAESFRILTRIINVLFILWFH